MNSHFARIDHAASIAAHDECDMKLARKQEELITMQTKWLEYIELCTNHLRCFSSERLNSISDEDIEELECQWIQHFNDLNETIRFRSMSDIGFVMLCLLKTCTSHDARVGKPSNDMNPLLNQIKLLSLRHLALVFHISSPCYLQNDTGLQIAAMIRSLQDFNQHDRQQRLFTVISSWLSQWVPHRDYCTDKCDNLILQGCRAYRDPSLKLNTSDPSEEPTDNAFHTASAATISSDGGSLLSENQILKEQVFVPLCARLFAQWNLEHRLLEGQFDLSLSKQKQQEQLSYTSKCTSHPPIACTGLIGPIQFSKLENLLEQYVNIQVGDAFMRSFQTVAYESILPVNSRTNR